MRLRYLLFLFVLIIPTSSFAASNEPKKEIPVYKGSEVVMEVNLSNEDILPMLKVALPMAGNILNQKGITEEDITAVFKDVEKIEFVQIQITKPESTIADISKFYSNVIPSADWNRVFWQNNTQTGMIALFAKKGGDAIYGFRIQKESVGGRPVKTVSIGKMSGKIDYVKLITIAAKFIKDSK